MEHNAPLENKSGSDALTTHSDMKKNIPRGLSLTINFLYSTYPINIQAEQS
jgi:hypothetical protein